MLAPSATAPPALPSDGSDMLREVVASLGPLLPWLIAAVTLLALLAAPLPGRGPRTRRRDPWRTFKYGARRSVMEAAGHRCEAPTLVFWGRCRRNASEADHIYPWSRGGATVVSNGQALCRTHNRAKGAATPPWWYVLGLERRRRSYYPDGVPVRVQGSSSGRVLR